MQDQQGHLEFFSNGSVIVLGLIVIIVTGALCWAAWHRSNYRKRIGLLELLRLVLVGAVSRTGHVIAQLIPNITGETIANFIRDNVDTKRSKLYTDQFTGYNTIGKEMEHKTLNRSKKWEKGDMYTNTIEGFWSFIKRAWYGSHHHYSTGYTPLYLAEACYKYNYRKHANVLGKFLKECMT